MTVDRLRSCRSLLFLPASNPRAVAKARLLPCDLVILDCEDAVPEGDKALARMAAMEAVAEGFGERLQAIRINPVGTPWHEADIAAVRTSAAHFVVLPKAEDATSVADVAAACDKPVMAMIETATGVLAAPQIARAAGGLIAGTNDLAADLAIPPGAGRQGLTFALQAMIVAARAACIPVFDGVFNRLEDGEGLAKECEEGRSFGFDGKSVIHPAQIDTANRSFSPSEEELAAARRLIAAANGGAERFEGRMIESMHVAQAKALLARAGQGD
jgi:citrate lyase subunit beta/citryl-CoA lyase